jgi:hypothetical protein
MKEHLSHTSLTPLLVWRRLELYNLTSMTLPRFLSIRRVSQTALPVPQPPVSRFQYLHFEQSFSTQPGPWFQLVPPLRACITASRFYILHQLGCTSRHTCRDRRRWDEFTHILHLQLLLKTIYTGKQLW